MNISSLLLEVTVTTLSATGTLFWMQCGTEVNGAYAIETKEIYVCEQGALGDNPNIILYHEIGHHFWFDHMTEKEKNKYKSMWKIHKKKNRAFLRDYSKKTVEEWFADDFGMFALNADIFSIENRIRKKYIERILKNK